MAEPGPPVALVAPADPVPAAIPRATARLQLHRDFDFEQARLRAPYFAALGISHLYLSPILTARAGSRHGYDMVDFSAVNPELGGEAGLRRLVATLREFRMGAIVDIVPNHMAVGRADNRAWLDVLEWGRLSRYAEFFDIDWDVPDPALAGRVLAPFLGRPYGEALAAGEIALRFDPAQGRFHADYFEHRFPIAPGSYGWLLRFGGEALSDWSRRFRLALAVTHAARGDTFEQACLVLAAAARDPTVAAELAQLLARFNTQGSGLLHRLLERQHYRLAWWRSAADEINWRRFFDVIELAGVRIQQPAAFELMHATVLRLYAEGLIDGVRVDHIDGLADPRSYCRRLRARLARLTHARPATAPAGPPYIVVEKILAPREALPADWHVDGSTGYSFMNEVSALLHDPGGEAPLTRLWAELSGSDRDFASEEARARRRIPQELLASDFNACAHALHQVARLDPATRDWSLLAIRRVLAEVLVQFPVYRTYADARGRSAADTKLMVATLAAAAPHCRPAERPLLALLDRWLGGEPPRQVTPAVARRARLRAIGRFQQLSTPVAAKAVEDTAFYRHGRLLSRNEVGANPSQFSLDAEGFHAEFASRAARYPRAMLATATHDHKRGEDLRARLAVLSEVPVRWSAIVQDWRRANAPLKQRLGDAEAPDAADEYMLYQMLVGAWPLMLRPDDHAGLTALRERLAGWGRKAMREAKRHSSWAQPDEAYETAGIALLETLLQPGHFATALHGFVDSIAPAGAINGLAQTLIRLAAPGVPDLYQGCEWWDFSLVDPDNRRPVDFDARQRALAQAVALEELLEHWRDGRIKQRIIRCALAERAARPTLFCGGGYRALRPRGELARHAFGFAREHAGDAALAVAARFSAGLAGERPTIPVERWGDTTLELPKPLRNRRWRCAFTGECFEGRRAVPLAELLQTLPVALWIAE